MADPTENVIDLVAAKFSREGKGYPESYLCCLKERLILLGVGYIVVFIQIVIIPRELFNAVLKQWRGRRSPIKRVSETL